MEPPVVERPVERPLAEKPLEGKQVAVQERASVSVAASQTAIAGVTSSARRTVTVVTTSAATVRKKILKTIATLATTERKSTRMQCVTEPKTATAVKMRNSASKPPSLRIGP